MEAITTMEQALQSAMGHLRKKGQKVAMLQPISDDSASSSDDDERSSLPADEEKSLCDAIRVMWWDDYYSFILLSSAHAPFSSTRQRWNAQCATTACYTQNDRET